ncbi:hypothetical protein N7456_008574 [Penicillium angulare]|uniref:Nudix hydrolase domain-containing protein n=1 Tax=Penicillium angulare TaxID=116970 RepID=A0A9W9K4D9_9EURO|nr:hypothetical protein N7456_008574 [Penicillium angulare]
MDTPASQAGLSHFLHNVLSELYQHPSPHVPDPPTCKKRASVALILRVRPTYNHWPTSSSIGDPSLTVEDRLDEFFSQPWVQNGDPEVLFIKRAARVGDRWTGHIALPGGKRDPEDADDQAAAIREAWEEIGLDLTTDDCIHVGNLPERWVTTSWGSVPLMTLCPFVFLTTRSDSPTLNLQPTEVASTHWIPLKALLSSSVRTVEHVDISQRFTKQSGFLARMAVRSMMGYMQFSAVRLLPSESQQCSSVPGFIPNEKTQPSFLQSLKSWCLSNQAESGERDRPLLLWGLTLGILTDFLGLFPPNNAVHLWKPPTFGVPDLRLIVSILTYNLRKHNKQQLKAAGILKHANSNDKPNALSTTSDAERPGSSGQAIDGHAYAVGIMLHGYYDRLRMAIYVFLAWRIALGSAAGFTAWRFFRRR